MTITIERDDLLRLVRSAVRMELKGIGEKEWLTAKECAELIGRKDHRTVRENIVTGKWDIKFSQINRRYLFNTSSIINFIKTQSV